MTAGCIKCIRYLVFVFNFIFWLLGLGILGFGIYLRVDPKVATIVGATPSQELYVAAYVLIGIGAVMTVVGFLGCCGAYQESPCLLGAFFSCLLVIFAAQVAAGVVGYLKRDDASTYWNTTLSNFVFQYGWTNATAQTTAMDAIQNSMACCGAGSPLDYVKTDWYVSQGNLLYYPPSCCDQPQVMTNLKQNPIVNVVQGAIGTTQAPKKGCLVVTVPVVVYKDGCIATSMALFASQWWILVAVGGVILLVELLGMIFGITLCCSVRRRNNNYDDGYEQPEAQNLVA